MGGMTLWEGITDSNGTAVIKGAGANAFDKSSIAQPDRQVNCLRSQLAAAVQPVNRAWPVNSPLSTSDCFFQNQKVLTIEFRDLGRNYPSYFSIVVLLARINSLQA